MASQFGTKQKGECMAELAQALRSGVKTDTPPETTIRCLSITLLRSLQLSPMKHNFLPQK
jgi:hypothetical protein